ncbi:MAG: hypothetical protein Q9222_002444 [Ikaeria aurantiellina]
MPRILRQVKRLTDLIAKYDGQPVLLNDVMSWFAFDTMGEFLFNSGFDMMHSNSWHPVIVQQRRALALLAPLNDVTWLVQFLFAFLPFVGYVRDWNRTVAFCDDAMQKRMKADVKEEDIASWFIDEFERLKDRTSLRERLNVLSGNTLTAIIAGRIHEELATCDVMDDTALAALPHLEAVINETLRLCPPAMTEIRLVIASLLNRFQVSFAADQDIDSVIHNMKDQITAQPGDCRLVFTPRTS